MLLPENVRICYRGARMISPGLRRRIITVTQRKGGVGKTTIAVCVAAALARRGHNVALVDSDPQRSASQWAEPGNLEFPVYEMALDRDPPTQASACTTQRRSTKPAPGHVTALT